MDGPERLVGRHEHDDTEPLAERAIVR
jgi:hypothetical protein